MKKPTTVLICDDDRSTVELMVACVKSADPDALILSTTAPEDAIKYGSYFDFDYAFVDWLMPGLDGGDVLAALNDGCMKLLLTAVEITDKIQSKAIKSGAHGVYRKPIQFGKIADILRSTYAPSVDVLSGVPV